MSSFGNVRTSRAFAEYNELIGKPLYLLEVKPRIPNGPDLFSYTAMEVWFRKPGVIAGSILGGLSSISGLDDPLADPCEVELLPTRRVNNGYVRSNSGLFSFHPFLGPQNKSGFVPSQARRGKAFRERLFFPYRLSANTSLECPPFSLTGRTYEYFLLDDFVSSSVLEDEVSLQFVSLPPVRTPSSFIQENPRVVPY